jgi:hypothetical protein
MKRANELFLPLLFDFKQVCMQKNMQCGGSTEIKRVSFSAMVDYRIN